MEDPPMQEIVSVHLEMGSHFVESDVEYERISVMAHMVNVNSSVQLVQDPLLLATFVQNAGSLIGPPRFSLKFRRETRVIV